ncbi:MAG TPA: hypothetical protein DCM38_12005, partial [Gammaproteobacteria bacterium]|nr:hypothetical protein [Gammaproteobacteria bacterium]
MDDVVKELLWWVLSRIIAPLLLLVFLVQLWNANPEKQAEEEIVSSSRTESRQNSQSSYLNHLQEEGAKAYYIADYPTALEKWKTGLEKARERGNKRYISQFLCNIGNVYQNLGQ